MIAYQYGQGIEDRDVYAAFLKKEWGLYGPNDAEAFERRILNAGNGIIAMRYDGKPAAILETIRTFLDVEDIEDFDQLTGGGTWSTYNSRGRNFIMVDLTVTELMQGKGLSKRMVMDQLPRYLGNGIEGFFTLSPATARGMHEKFGARMAREIKNARKDYKTPDVFVMEYPIEVIESFSNGNGRELFSATA